MLTGDAFARLCRARDMLCEVHDRPVTLDTVAGEAAMSRFHFIRQFHALFGDTPHQVRVRAQLERAKQLLTLEHGSLPTSVWRLGSRG
jgi:AraC family transcriptional regulator